MAERSHLSIGEVLSLLREEFPDVTISKIRFLESQGLVDPERTPSGYRKFYEHDVERLRWILRQQRENFLPLKVIRGRLTEHEDPLVDVLGASSARPSQGDEERIGLGSVDGGAPAAQAGPDEVNGTDRPADPSGTDDQPETGPDRREGPTGVGDLDTDDAGPGNPTDHSATPRTPAAALPTPPGRPPTVSPSLFADLRSGVQSERGRRPDRPDPGSAAPAPRPAPVEAPTPNAGRSHGSAVVVTGKATARQAEEGDTYTAEELAATTGAAEMLVAELKQYGLIAAHAIVAGTPYFDDSALAVARVAAELAQHGVEVRHLRIWRNAVDRETDLFQQIVLPLLRQRNPQSRHQATDTLAELARLGGELRSALIDRAIHEIR